MLPTYECSIAQHDRVEGRSVPGIGLTAQVEGLLCRLGALTTTRVENCSTSLDNAAVYIVQLVSLAPQLAK